MACPCSKRWICWPSRRPRPRCGEVLQDIRKNVGEGISLDQAFARHPQVFGELAVSMVHAGMEGAFLEDALRRTAGFLDLQEELKGRLVGAMIYPAFLAGVGTVVTVALVVFFVPKFSTLFERLERSGQGLPGATIVLLAVSDAMRHYGVLILGAVAAAVYGIRHALGTPWGRRLLDRWKLKMPLFGKIFLGYAVSRFCRVLGTLLKNGVPLLKAMKSAAIRPVIWCSPRRFANRPRTSPPAIRCRGRWPAAA